MAKVSSAAGKERVARFLRDSGETEWFGRTLKELRLSRGLQQRELDEKLEEVVGRPHASFTAQVESGRLKPPGKETVSALEEILNVPPGVLWELAVTERLHALDPDIYAWHVSSMQSVWQAFGPVIEQQRAVFDVVDDLARAVARNVYVDDPLARLERPSRLTGRILEKVKRMLRALVEAHVIADLTEQRNPAAAFLGALEHLGLLKPERQGRLWTRFQQLVEDAAIDTGRLTSESVSDDARTTFMSMARDAELDDERFEDDEDDEAEDRRLRLQRQEAEDDIAELLGRPPEPEGTLDGITGRRGRRGAE